MWLLRWLLFRVEFGAGLIKMRGDRCWRDLTCLYYHHETQPMPGPLSWFFHHLPRPLHRVESGRQPCRATRRAVRLFTPQPIAGSGRVAMVITQLWLVLSGNFAWLNWVTIALGLSAAAPLWRRAVRSVPARLRRGSRCWSCSPRPVCRAQLPAAHATC